MRPFRFLFLLAFGGAFVSSPALADNCADLATRFSGVERFSMKIAELDELKTCINMILREKISATSSEARGSTSPASAAEGSAQATRPKAAPALQDAE
ncbi:MAG TPA: hypothetical protein VF050_06360 [Moraxellaceae bacterium]